MELQLATAVEGIEHQNICRWVEQTFATLNRQNAPLTVRIVAAAEIQQLNCQYRNKNCVTNVLAFPFEPIEGVEDDYLGDIVICFSVVKNESKQLDKCFSFYFARILIHGVLHLLGYDHQTDEEEQVMTQREQQILTTIFPL